LVKNDFLTIALKLGMFSFSVAIIAKQVQ